MDNKKNTPLHLATIDEEVEIVKTLLIKGANVNIQDSNEKITPFFCAYGNIIKIFFDYAIDLDLNKRNFEGNTAFEDALDKDEIETIMMIVYFQSF